MAYIFDDLKQSRGGRISSPLHRRSYQQSEAFTGLAENVNRYDLLILAKRAGKKFGFTPRMISLLDYYISFTRECDWEQGSSPVVYQSLSRTAFDMGISERQVQRLEQKLFEAGALTWHDSGNHKRYGKRDESGRILFAYGVDLTPLAFLKDQLQEVLEEKQLYEQAWMETKRQISYYRGQIRAVMCEMELLSLDGQGDFEEAILELQKSYEPLSLQIRTSLSLERVRDLLAKHRELYVQAIKILPQDADLSSESNNASANSQETKKESSRNDSHDVHYNSTIKKQSNKLDTCRARPNAFQEKSSQPQELQAQTLAAEESFSEEEELVLATGLQHITLKQALNASSERFRSNMPMEHRPMNWNDFVESAYRLKSELSISQNSWAKACAVLGRTGAAICLLLTDRAAQRDHSPVYKTGAYFNAMINRAKTGELHLHNSIFGILEKEYGDQDAA